VIVALRTALFSLVFYPGSLVFVLAALAASPVSQRGLFAATRGWSLWHDACCRIVLGQRLVIEGELLDQPVLYVFKHEAMYETIQLPRLFSRPAIMAKRELLDIPLWGRVARNYGLVPVEREAGAGALRVMMAAARKATAAGRPICLFPEGTRMPHGEAPPLRSGFTGLYKLLALPVIPVALDSGIVNPRRSWRRYPGTVTFRVGETIPPGLPRDEIERRVHAAINALNDAPTATRVG